MKCIKCETEMESNVCSNCGYDLTKNNELETSEKKPSTEMRYLKDESLNSIMNMTKKIIDENKIDNESTLLEKSVDNQEKELFETIEFDNSTNEVVVSNSFNDEVKVEDKTIVDPLELEQNNSSEVIVDLKKDTLVEDIVLDDDLVEQNSANEKMINLEDEPIIEVIENASMVEIKDSKATIENKKENNIAQNDDSIIKASDVIIKDDLDIFVGKNSDNIIYNKYSFLGGILGELWLLYRKCYVPGIILGILNCLFVAYVLFLTETPIYVYFIVKFILYFIISKEIYITSAKKKIKKIEKENINDSEEEVTEKIQKKGGTCILAPIIYAISIIIIVVGIFFFIYKFGTYNFNSLKIRFEGWTINESNQLVYTSKDKTCVASIYYSTKEDQSINAILYQKGVINEQQYLDQTGYDLNQFDKENINNNDWYKITLTNENNLSEDILITEKDNYIYLVNLKGVSENDYQLCQETFNDLKSRFEFR